MESQSRRGFLKGLLAVVGALFAGVFSGRRTEAGWFGGEGSKDRWVSLGKLTDLPDGKNTPIKTATNLPDGKPVKRPKIIADRRGNQVYVMSTRCTHFGCEVELQADGTYKCPCHGAKYDKVGTVTKGPAKKSLTWCPVKVTETGDVQVNLGATVETPKLD